MDFLESRDAALRKARSEQHLLHQQQLLIQRLNNLQKENDQLRRDLTGNPGGCSDLDYKRYELQQVLDMYRLTGISLLPSSHCDSTSFTVRFDPLFGDQLPSAAFYTLQVTKKGDNYQTGQHSLPPFVPLDNLVKDYLDAGELSTFLEQISNHLYSYVQRREACALIKKEFKLMLGDSLEVDLPVTFVRMSLTVSESVPPLEVTLQYKTSDVYPHKVYVRFSTSEDTEYAIPRKKLEKLCSRAETILLQNLIYPSMKAIVKMLQVLHKHHSSQKE
ncbi:uncharacterized protein LOC127841141 [Dreissena polymorpha]|uniref:uncharacterized protein LOC127841141 n=1 Tax=Dreissena polymorpha TaxID=45954 RepID=UPI00226415A6|nr:uncharacterized protein LOC127841141 [Dreissena polymorpha]XP_052225725.1 uncharacterized protein LOC127841141 [Dreissena polymorpha]XP_052225726.1 uncharacterized protein LOC127841141 [Dreissena polymorpha]XP_052225727.1 uncharacterized protein LOC127841141 [Dreissena polymorpha]XP_052225728.1 uncharacterized protein LOC127841141 [Dreissena polymorpha]XP_052225730.1 uncharacterized protein LOC127841141 [Dreissena polymorpha]XP_052225731.1 uncharacterized protein LOC127841141 [Dreissena po